MTNHVDPTTVRLSKHFLLSDFMGCNSVYSKGYPNVFVDSSGRKIREAEALCENVLEPLLDYSRLSISYGYISPELSRQIVKYQDPNKPSYHRWDHGAACDVVLHERIALDEAPIRSAFWIDENLPVSRVITYSESPFICVASRLEEINSGDYRRALYENRYMGERKPKYISYSDNPTSRRKQKLACDLPHGWEGGGFPSYHGGGIRQVQHIRTGRFSVLSDFLFSSSGVREGCQNVPSQRARRKFDVAGAVYDELLVVLKLRRMSIIRAYESPTWSRAAQHNWTDSVWFCVVPPEGVAPGDVADAAWNSIPVHSVGVHEDCVTIGAHL